MGVGVVGAAVVVVTLLTFLAPDSDRPLIGRPVGAVQSILPGVLEQVEDRVVQATTLLGVDEESVRNVGENMSENMSAGLTAARSGLSEVWAPTPGVLPAAGPAPATPAPEGSFSSPATDESSPPQTATEPSAPSSSSGGGTGEISAPDGPPITEASPPTMTSEPTASSSVTEEPSPPPPPAAEEPQAPPKDEPAPPTAAEEPPPLVTEQPKAE